MHRRWVAPGTVPEREDDLQRPQSASCVLRRSDRGESLRFRESVDPADGREWVGRAAAVSYRWGEEGKGKGKMGHPTEGYEEKEQRAAWMSTG